MKNLIFALTLLLPLLCSASTDKTVITSISGNIISLKDGRKLELAGIITPPEQAIKASELIQKFIGQEIHLSFGKQQKNRHSNYMAQVKTASGQWLQGAVLEAGLAFVYPTSDNNLMIAQMQEAEQKARNNKAGLWQNPENLILKTEDAIANLQQYRGKFKIVEGMVYSVKKTKDKTYINFDKDWKTDFSIGISKENTKNFKDIEGLQGHKIRVRGWLESYNGPFIEVYEPGQLEIF